MDFRLSVTVDAENSATHDLQLVTGQPLMVTDTLEEVAQRLRIRLQFFKGEWFLDTREGVPYFQNILLKGVSKQTITAIFSRILRDTPGIALVNSFSYDLDSARRVLTLRFQVTIEDGRVFTSDDFGPFLVEF